MSLRERGRAIRPLVRRPGYLETRLDGRRLQVAVTWSLRTAEAQLALIEASWAIRSTLTCRSCDRFTSTALRLEPDASP